MLHIKERQDFLINLSIALGFGVLRPPLRENGPPIARRSGVEGGAVRCRNYHKILRRTRKWLIFRFLGCFGAFLGRFERFSDAKMVLERSERFSGEKMIFGGSFRELGKTVPR